MMAWLQVAENGMVCGTSSLHVATPIRGEGVVLDVALEHEASLPSCTLHFGGWHRAFCQGGEAATVEGRA
jgi:hypothetical protein